MDLRLYRCLDTPAATLARDFTSRSYQQELYIHDGIPECSTKKIENYNNVMPEKTLADSTMEINRFILSSDKG
ncbi:MAG: hypothetical protein WBN83_06990 [Desulfoprunum sp.]|jgi:hypothetical protein|uniref:hypothetical protein n=1 Tax=Desulfoprunum sp. TaxID=2020866 RepID=UPI003C761569